MPRRDTPKFHHSPSPSLPLFSHHAKPCPSNQTTKVEKRSNKPKHCSSSYPSSFFLKPSADQKEKKRIILHHVLRLTPRMLLSSRTYAVVSYNCFHSILLLLFLYVFLFERLSFHVYLFVRHRSFIAHGHQADLAPPSFLPASQAYPSSARPE